MNEIKGFIEFLKGKSKEERRVIIDTITNEFCDASYSCLEEQLYEAQGIMENLEDDVFSLEQTIEELEGVIENINEDPYADDRSL